MHVYVVIAYDIHDFETYKKYPPSIGPLLSKSGAKVLAMDPNPTVFEGTPKNMNVILEFPSENAAVTFYESKEYQDVINLRLSSCSGGTIILLKQFGN